MQRNHIAAFVAGLVLASLVVAGVTAGLGTVGAQETVPEKQSADRTITVSATGSADAAPDQAIVRVAVTADGENPDEIGDELAADAEELRDALEELGVDYETTEYSIRESRRHHEKEDPPAFRGEHAFEITLDDPDETGAVVDAATGAGAEIGTVQLTLSEETRDDLRDEAIEDAMDDARHQADTVAASGDLAVTGAATVDATQRHFRPVEFDGAVESADAAPPTEISGGDVSVAYSVQVTYNATDG